MNIIEHIGYSLTDEQKETILKFETMGELKKFAKEQGIPLSYELSSKSGKTSLRYKCPSCGNPFITGSDGELCTCQDCGSEFYKGARDAARFG